LQLRPASIFKATIKKLNTLTSVSTVRLPCSDFCCIGGIERVTKDSEWQLKSGLCHQASKDDKVKRKEKSPLEKSIKTLAAQI